MLLNLLMMFAELEQKTIAGRVRDNYYARAAQQLALGWNARRMDTPGKNVRISNHTATILEVQPDEAAPGAGVLYGLRHRRAERGTAGAGGKPFRAAAPETGRTGRTAPFCVSCAARCMSGATSGALSFCRNRAWN